MLFLTTAMREMDIMLSLLGTTGMNKDLRVIQRLHIMIRILTQRFMEHTLAIRM